MTGQQWSTLQAHLFPGDHDEHGAILRCGLSETERGIRLLVREVILATDGLDYVPGTYGYRKLDASFVLDAALDFSEDQSVYIAVHCHGGSDSVAFSSTDLKSHELGYPGLLALIGAPIVGALVFAANAVAGDLWLSDGSRVEVAELVITDPVRQVLRPRPLSSTKALPEFDRQARLFGDRGQEILAGQRIAIVGLGGAGSLICEMLSRLGVGEIILIDDDRVDPSNLSRIVGATRRDARAWMVDPRRPRWMQRLGGRTARPKVEVAARVARVASRVTKVTPIFRNVADPDVAVLLRDCDHIFLAADSATARLIVNAVVHQYLVSASQVGAKVVVDQESGRVIDVFAVSRLILPGHGCLKCNGLISPDRLREEASTAEQLRRQRYVEEDGVHAPSVISLNAIATSRAVDEWLMRLVGLADAPKEWMHYDSIAGETSSVLPRRDSLCPQCGSARFARGDSVRLPTKVK